MKIKIISSGSSGNAYLITDKNKKQLLVECGIIIKKLLREIDLNNLQGCIISHCHSDHCIAKENLKRYSVPVFDNTNMESGKVYHIGDYKVFPIQSKHNVPCLGFIINCARENKKILFATDTYEIDPKTPDIPYDAALLECNYSKEYISRHETDNDGFYNHMSCERLLQWLENRRYKPKNLCLIHLSNNGNLGEYDLKDAFKSQCENLYIAAPGEEIDVI